jgi:hypothetical protein
VQELYRVKIKQYKENLSLYFLIQRLMNPRDFSGGKKKFAICMMGVIGFSEKFKSSNGWKISLIRCEVSRHKSMFIS